MKGIVRKFENYLVTHLAHIFFQIGVYPLLYLEIILSLVDEIADACYDPLSLPLLVGFMGYVLLIFPTVMSLFFSHWGRKHSIWLRVLFQIT